MFEVRCSCCGIRAHVASASERPVCSLCRSICDGAHGADLQRTIERRLAQGRITWSHALAVCLVDDAWLSGCVTLRPAEGGADIIVQCPERWRVVIARAACLDEMPAIADVCGAVLERHFGRDNVQRVRDEISDEMTRAFQALDPDVERVEVGCKRSTMAPDEIIVDILKRTNVEPGAVVTFETPVEVPDDIMLRSRGQA